MNLQQSADSLAFLATTIRFDTTGAMMQQVALHLCTVLGRASLGIAPNRVLYQMDVEQEVSSMLLHFFVGGCILVSVGTERCNFWLILSTIGSLALVPSGCCSSIVV